MSPIRDAFLPTNFGRREAHDLISPTPYSAVCPLEFIFPSFYSTQSTFDSNAQVSSFNLPIQYDQLITPVSLSESLAANTKPAYLPSREMDVRLSPSELSPGGYETFHAEDDYNSERHAYPMKYKHPPSGRLHITTSDQSFPPSPLVPSTPYFGPYGGVSSTPLSERSESLPSMNQSPIGHNGHSAGGMSNDGRHSRLPTPAQSYKARPMEPVRIAPTQAHPVEPIRIAPTPPALRPAFPNGDPFRQNILPSIQHPATPSPAGQGPIKPLSALPLGFLPLKRKRKSSHEPEGDIFLSGDMTFEERILMELVEREGLPWKEVAARFRERTGKNMKVAALQMRKKRLIERLRIWTSTDVLDHPSLPLPTGYTSLAQMLTRP